jgi:hypothetical protein
VRGHVPRRDMRVRHCMHGVRRRRMCHRMAHLACRLRVRLWLRLGCGTRYSQEGDGKQCDSVFHGLFPPGLDSPSADQYCLEAIPGQRVPVRTKTRGRTHP